MSHLGVSLINTHDALSQRAIYPFVLLNKLRPRWLKVPNSGLFIVSSHDFVARCALTRTGPSFIGKNCANSKRRKPRIVSRITCGESSWRKIRKEGWSQWVDLHQSEVMKLHQWFQSRVKFLYLQQENEWRKKMKGRKRGSYSGGQSRRSGGSPGSPPDSRN